MTESMHEISDSTPPMDSRPPAVMSVPQGRIPPHNLDAERSLLGGILLDGRAFDDVIAIVRGSDFYRDAHRIVFEAMTDLSQRNEPIDRITLKNALVMRGLLERVGGEELIDLLDMIVPTAANLTYYAKIIADKALARRLIEAGTHIAQMGYDQHGDVHEFADVCERKIFEVRQTRRRISETISTKQLVKNTFTEIEMAAERESTVTGVASGLTALDELTCGFQPADFVVFAARPGHGKTSLLLDILRTLGRTKTGSSLMFEMEMPKGQLMKRLLGSEGRIDSRRLLTGRLSEAEWARLAVAGSAISEMNITIDDEARTLLEVRAVARRKAAELAGTAAPLKLVGVDYLQRMQAGVQGDRRTRDEMFSEISAGLKSLAKELGIPVVGVSSMNREIEKRQNRKPQMSDLRECGSLEFDADTIIFVHRDGDKVELDIGKQRNGPVGVAHVGFRPQFTTFVNLDDDDRPKQAALPISEPSREEPPPPTDADRRYP